MYICINLICISLYVLINIICISFNLTVDPQTFYYLFDLADPPIGLSATLITFDPFLETFGVLCVLHFCGIRQFSQMLIHFIIGTENCNT